MLPLRSTLAAFLLTASLLTAAPAYEFTLDGKPAEPRILPVLGEAKGDITEGDIAFFRNFTFVVGKPGRYAFRIEGELLNPMLLCRFNGGLEHLLATCYLLHGGPLDKMTAKERQLLRGITLVNPLKDWESKLKGIDWSKTALSIDPHFAEDGVLPKLPDELHYLHYESGNSESIEDFSNLKQLKHLRYANIDSYPHPFDLRWLGKSGKMRNLSMNGTPVTHTEGLASLTEMRFLKLRWTLGLETVSFAEQMPHLRVLKIDENAVSDLKPLNGLKHLRLLSATRTEVKVLPDPKSLPALLDLRLLATPVASDAGAIATFRKGAPACLIKARWAETLQLALVGATKLQVREVDFDEDRRVSRKPVFELSNADLIDSLVKSIEIDEGNSGFHCMCIGDSFLEFYKGGKLLTTVGFHHGRSLRWDQRWPGDALLTDESADLLCDFMADHGLTHPKKERGREKARDRAEQRYWDAVHTILPQSVLKAAWLLANPDPNAEDVGERKRMAAFHELFTKQWPGAKARAEAMFSIHGALPEMSWNLSTGIDDLVQEHLLAPSSDQISTLLATEPNEQTLQGIARWCFFDQEGERARLKLSETELPTLSAWGLTHPRPINRRKTLLALDTKLGEPLLLAFLQNPPIPRPLADELRPEPGGSSTHTPESRDLPVDGSDRITAAFILAKRGCTAARPTIKQLTTTAPEDHRPHYIESLKILDKKAK